MLGAKKGMSPWDAYSMASTAIDFSIAEAVDETLVIYGKIPKAYFKSKTPYWTKQPPLRSRAVPCGPRIRASGRGSSPKRSRSGGTILPSRP